MAEPGEKIEATGKQEAPAVGVEQKSNAPAAGAEVAAPNPTLPPKAERPTVGEFKGVVTGKTAGAVAGLKGELPATPGAQVKPEAPAEAPIGEKPQAAPAAPEAANKPTEAPAAEPAGEKPAAEAGKPEETAEAAESEGMADLFKKHSFAKMLLTFFLSFSPSLKNKPWVEEIIGKEAIMAMREKQGGPIDIAKYSEHLKNLPKLEKQGDNPADHFAKLSGLPGEPDAIIGSCRKTTSPIQIDGKTVKAKAFRECDSSYTGSYAYGDILLYRKNGDFYPALVNDQGPPLKAECLNNEGQVVKFDVGSTPFEGAELYVAYHRLAEAEEQTAYYQEEEAAKKAEAAKKKAAEELAKKKAEEAAAKNS